MDELTCRFFHAIEQIEGQLRRSCADAALAPHSRALHLAAKTMSAVRYYAHELQEFFDLRGAITRGVRGEESMATPSLKLVVRMEAVSTCLLSPPVIGNLFRTPVATCNLDSTVSIAINRMMHGGYSQLPVYSETALEGVLTLEMIGRWVGHGLAKQAAINPEANVGAVLQLAETPQNYDVMAPTDNVFDALERFQEFQKCGRRLDAIVIAPNASRKHRPSGIISAADVPKLYEAIR